MGGSGVIKIKDEVGILPNEIKDGMDTSTGDLMETTRDAVDEAMKIKELAEILKNPDNKQGRPAYIDYFLSQKSLSENIDIEAIKKHLDYLRKYLLSTHSSSLSNASSVAGSLGLNNLRIEIGRCSTLIQRDIFLGAVRLFIHSYDNNIAYQGFNKTRLVFLGESAIGTNIGHGLAYAGWWSEKDDDIFKIREIFSQIRQSFKYDAPADELYELFKSVEADLSRLCPNEDSEDMYFELCDKVGASRKRSIWNRIALAIDKKKPSSVYAGMWGRKVEFKTALEKKAYDATLVWQDRWLKNRGWQLKDLQNEPFRDFIHESIELDDLLNIFNDEGEDSLYRKDTNYEHDFILQRTLYRPDVVEFCEQELLK